MKTDISAKLDKAAGRKVRELRRAAEKTQEWLAEKIGVTYQQLQKYEKGKDAMRLSGFVRACEALGADPVAMLAEIRKAIP